MIATVRISIHVEGEERTAEGDREDKEPDKMPHIIAPLLELRLFRHAIHLSTLRLRGGWALAWSKLLGWPSRVAQP